MFGTLLLTVIFVNLVLASCGIYLATNLTCIVTKGDIRGRDFAGALYGVTSLLVSVFTLVTLRNIHRAGQLLTDAYRY